MKKMLILLLCLPFCLCACQAEPETPPSGVLRADYWSAAPKIRSVEEFVSQLSYQYEELTDEHRSSSLQNITDVSDGIAEDMYIVYARSYQEYLEKIKPSQQNNNIDVFWEDVEILGKIDICTSHSFSLTLSKEDHTAKLGIRIGDGAKVETYNRVFANNILLAHYGLPTKPLPTQWVKLDAIDCTNPMRLPQQIQTDLEKEENGNHFYYVTSAGFHLYYENGQLTSLSGFRGRREVTFEWEGDYAMVEDIPFTSLRRLIELATRTV